MRLPGNGLVSASTAAFHAAAHHHTALPLRPSRHPTMRPCGAQTWGQKWMMGTASPGITINTEQMRLQDGFVPTWPWMALHKSKESPQKSSFMYRAYHASQDSKFSLLHDTTDLGHYLHGYLLYLSRYFEFSAAIWRYLAAEQRR